MSQHNDDLNSTEVKKVSLAELMKKKLESQKQNQQNSRSFSNSNGANNKVKSQQTKKSTMHRRTGE